MRRTVKDFPLKENFFYDKTLSVTTSTLVYGETDVFLSDQKGSDYRNSTILTDPIKKKKKL